MPIEKSSLLLTASEEIRKWGDSALNDALKELQIKILPSWNVTTKADMVIKSLKEQNNRHEEPLESITEEECLIAKVLKKYKNSDHLGVLPREKRVFYP